MREIKFRAFYEGEMWTVIAAHFHDGDVDLELQREEGGKFPKADPSYQKENLMQYTGLKDKNGVEIYEGDILQYGGNLTGPVVWDNDYSCFQFDTPKMAAFYLDSGTIVGNIHENLGLLNE